MLALTWAWPLCSCREGGSARAWLTSCRSSELLTAHATRGRRADTPHVHGSALTLSPLVIKSHGQGGRGLVAIHFLFAQGRACLDQQRCRCGGGRGRGRRRRMRSTPMAAPRGRRTGQVHRLSARPLAAWLPGRDGGYRVPRAPTSSERNWMRSKDPRPHAESSLSGSQWAFSRLAPSGADLHTRTITSTFPVWTEVLLRLGK
jgi:hypothetical protein